MQDHWQKYYAILGKKYLVCLIFRVAKYYIYNMLLRNLAHGGVMSMKNKHLRNLAMQLASQLPDDPDDLYFVLELMRELSDYWLYYGRNLYPKGYVPITPEFYEERLRVLGLDASAREASIEVDSKVIRFAGKPDRSPR